MKGLDYSHSRPDLKRVKALGYGFVVRYLFAPAPGGKGITRAEATAIRAAGLGLVCVYEEYAGRAREGRASGVADGRIALAFAKAIGLPDNKPIYFAVDFNATPGHYLAIDAYLQGVAYAIGIARVGVYGSFAVVEHCHKVGTARWFWQTYAWSAGKVSAHAHLLQYSNGVQVAGATVDLNESKQWNFGSWEPITKPVVVVKPIVPKPAVTPKPAFHLMTVAELLAMVNAPKPVITAKPAVPVTAPKPAFHIMTVAELLAMIKNALTKK